jgi:hypothetical protein
MGRWRRARGLARNYSCISCISCIKCISPKAGRRASAHKEVRPVQVPRGNKTKRRASTATTAAYHRFRPRVVRVHRFPKVKFERFPRVSTSNKHKHITHQQPQQPQQPPDNDNINIQTSVAICAIGHGSRAIICGPCQKAGRASRLHGRCLLPPRLPTMSLTAAASRHGWPRG